MIEYVPTPLKQVDYDLVVQAASSIGLITRTRRYGHPDESAACMVQVGASYSLCIATRNSVNGRSALSVARTPFDTRFCEELRAGLEDPLVVLLLSLAPNIREISIMGAPQDIHSLSWDVPHGFKKLERFTATGIDDRLDWPLAGYGPLFTKGKLKTLQASCATDYLDGIRTGPHANAFQSHPVWLESFHNSLTLTRITLRHCAISCKSIKVPVDGCKALESFSYSAGGCNIGPLPFSAPQIKHVFLCQSSPWRK